MRSSIQVGTLESSPFIFEHHNLKYINVIVNGDQTTSVPIEMSYGEDLFLDAYYNMFYGLGIVGEDMGVDLDLDTFKNSFCVYLFNLSQTKDGFSTPRYGNLMLSLKFNSAPSKALTCLVYCEFPSILTINNNREVSFKDFSTEFQPV